MRISKDELINLLSDFNPKPWKSHDLLIDCPYCGERECYISIIMDNHPFNCVRKKKCGEQGNIYTLLNKLGRSDLRSIKPKVTWEHAVETSLISLETTLDITLNECKLPMGFRRIENDVYLKKRGFIDEDYLTYNVGETRLDPKLIGYAIFVIQNDHKQVAYIGRYKSSKEDCERLNKIRYRNSDSDFAKIIGNYDSIIKDVTKTVILVEGLFDEKNVSDLLNLRVDDELKCCFTFKCSVSDEQILKLQEKGVENIILLYDGDVLEKIKAEAIKLSKYFEVKVGLIEAVNEEGKLKDPGEINLDELMQVFETLQDPFIFFRNRVQILDL